MTIREDTSHSTIVLLVPGASEVLPGQVDTRTRITRGIELGIPLISAAMDTATKWPCHRDGAGGRPRRHSQESLP